MDRFIWSVSSGKSGRLSEPHRYPKPLAPGIGQLQPKETVWRGSPDGLFSEGGPCAPSEPARSQVQAGRSHRGSYVLSSSEHIPRARGPDTRGFSSPHETRRLISTSQTGSRAQGGTDTVSLAQLDSGSWLRTSVTNAKPGCQTPEPLVQTWGHQDGAPGGRIQKAPEATLCTGSPH